MIKFVSFDIDGTLIDLKYAQNEGCRHIYRSYGFDDLTGEKEFLKLWDELTESCYEVYLRRECTYEEQRIMRITELFDHYGRLVDKEEALGIYGDYLEAFENSWRPYDDVVPCLEGLSESCRLGAMSNGDVHQQTQKLERTGLLRYFENVTAAGEFARPKPDPEVFLSACARSGVDLTEFCYVGDNLKTDIYPCLALSMPCVFLNRKRIALNDDRIVSVNSLLALEQALSAL